MHRLIWVFADRNSLIGFVVRWLIFNFTSEKSNNLQAVMKPSKLKVFPFSSVCVFVCVCVWVEGRRKTTQGEILCFFGTLKYTEKNLLLLESKFYPLSKFLWENSKYVWLEKSLLSVLIHICVRQNSEISQENHSWGMNELSF